MLSSCGGQADRPHVAEPLAKEPARTPAPRPPSVRAGVTSVTGLLATELVREVVDKNVGNFDVCFEPALRDNPHLQGRADLAFLIDEQGYVAGMKGSGDLQAQDVIDCVVAAFSKLEFPPPKSGTAIVSYIIAFTPGD